MNIHDATEQAYKRGYEQGLKDIEMSMTETEIMKALVVHFDEDKPCAECPYVDIDEPCHILLKKDVQSVIDLLNRKNAEIEKKDKIIESYAFQYGTARDKDGIIAEAKAEAIKAVAERATEIFLDAKYVADDTHYARGCNAVIDYCINELDQIAKEMGVNI